MKKTTAFIITLLLVTTAAHAQWWGKGKKIKGNGNVTTITRTTSDYEKVSVSGSFDVELVYGTEGKLKLEGEENLLPYIETEVKGGNLKIKVQKGYSIRVSRGKKLLVSVPFKDINSVSLAGSGDVVSKNTIKARSFHTSLAGSGDIVLDVEANNVTMKVAGSGDLTVTGTTDNLETRLAGSGDIHAYKLKAKDVDVKLAGSGDIRIYAQESLKARVSGSGDISYRGKPSKEDTKVAGSGSISMD